MKTDDLERRLESVERKLESERKLAQVLSFGAAGICLIGLILSKCTEESRLESAWQKKQELERMLQEDIEKTMRQARESREPSH
ncbi:MAG: hypothetical protein MR890_09740 [Akkermansia muciniphila]|nr:hypothetical protein [Akkermansia muciniphila]